MRRNPKRLSSGSSRPSSPEVDAVGDHPEGENRPPTPFPDFQQPTEQPAHQVIQIEPRTDQAINIVHPAEVLPELPHAMPLPSTSSSVRNPMMAVQSSDSESSSFDGNSQISLSPIVYVRDFQQPTERPAHQVIQVEPRTDQAINIVHPAEVLPELPHAMPLPFTSSSVRNPMMAVQSSGSGSSSFDDNPSIPLSPIVHVRDFQQQTEQPVHQVIQVEPRADRAINIDHPAEELPQHAMPVPSTSSSVRNPMMGAQSSGSGSSSFDGISPIPFSPTVRVLDPAQRIPRSVSFSFVQIIREQLRGQNTLTRSRSLPSTPMMAAQSSGSGSSSSHGGPPISLPRIVQQPMEQPAHQIIQVEPRADQAISIDHPAEDLPDVMAVPSTSSSVRNPMMATQSSGSGSSSFDGRPPTPLSPNVLVLNASTSRSSPMQLVTRAIRFMNQNEEDDTPPTTPTVVSGMYEVASFVLPRLPPHVTPLYESVGKVNEKKVRSRAKKKSENENEEIKEIKEITEKDNSCFKSCGYGVGLFLLILGTLIYAGDQLAKK